MWQEGILCVLLGAGSWGTLGRSHRKSWVARGDMKTTANYQSIIEVHGIINQIGSIGLS